VDEILDEWRVARPEVDVSAQGIVGRVLRLSRYFERDLAEGASSTSSPRSGAPAGHPACLRPSSPAAACSPRRP
jgi:hypothetical protein